MEIERLMHIKLTYILSLLLFLTMLYSCKDNSEATIEKRKSKFHDLINIPTTQDGEIDTTLMSRIEAKETTHDFGIIQEGQVVSHIFTIKNVGKEDLYIIDSKSACGCTVSDYPKNAIRPGKEDQVKITFDTKGKNGKQEKKVSIFTNSIPNETIFAINANVVK